MSEAKHPDLGLSFAIPNAARRGPALAFWMKAEGMRAGVPDWCLPVPRGSYAGLWIEFKRPGGKLSDAQKVYGDMLQGHGHFVDVCLSAQAAIELVKWYLAQD